MSLKFNPFSGNFDFTGAGGGGGGGGGGASYIDGEVATYADLPLDVSAALNSAWLVREASGVWPVSRKQAGIYIRTATGGSSRDADYTYAGTMPDVFSDSQFTLYGDVDSTKNVKFNVDAQVGANQTRVITVPNKNITLDDAGDSRTPSSHTHGNLTNDGKVGTTANLPLKTGTNGVVEAGSFGTAAGSFCEGNDARLSDDRDPNLHAASHLPDGADEIFDQSLNTTDSVEFNALKIYTAASPTVDKQVLVADDEGNILSITGNEADARASLGLGDAAVEDTTAFAASGSITTSGLTQATARILGRTTASTGAVEEITVGSGLSLSAGELSSTVSAGIPATILDAKGDLIVASAADTAARLAVGGTNGHVLTVDSTETLGVKWAAAAGGVGGGTGSTDNSILRSDGTGGSTLQASAIVIEDAVSPFNITGDAGTDIITAVGHNYTANQGVRFPTLTGGSGLTAATTNYFVRDISGDTFKVSTTSGGSAVNFTTNITAGTVVAMQQNVGVTNNSSDTNSAIVLTPKGTGAFIAGPRPDGTAVGGNPRGSRAVCMVLNRGAATNVASGQDSVAIGGDQTVAGGQSSVAIGGYQCNASAQASVAIGTWDGVNTSGFGSVAIGGRTLTVSANFAGIISSERSVANAANTFIGGGEQARADRRAMQAHAAGQFAANGDAQRGRFVLRCKTTTNAAVEMALDGSTTYLTIPSGKVMFCNIKVVGVKSDGAVVATYERQYAAKNVAGTCSEVFAPVTIGTDNASSTSLEVATVDAGDYIRIRPTGITSETWRWVASVDAVEVAYGT
jgi:hypothetical protein